MSEEEKNIQALKQRAKEMLKGDNTRKIGAEDIYIIICEWEKNFNLISNLQKENEELKKHKTKYSLIKNHYISKDKIEEYRREFINDSKNEHVFMTQFSQINASLIQFCNKLLREE